MTLSLLKGDIFAHIQGHCLNLGYYLEMLTCSNDQ